MTSLAYITAAPWSAPVSMQSTPREVDGLRPSRQKYIGKHVKPVVGGKVLLTQKVMSIKASEFSLRHYRRDISAGRPGIISIVYKDYCWVNWDNGQGCWYNTGLDGRYDLIERPPRETRTLSQRIKKQELMAAFHRQNRQGVKKKPDQRESGSPAGVRTISAGQLSSAGNHVARSKEDMVSRH